MIADMLRQRKSSRQYWDRHSAEIISLITEGGIIITRTEKASSNILKSEGLNVLEIGDGFTCGIRSKAKVTPSLEGKTFVIVVSIPWPWQVNRRTM